MIAVLINLERKMEAILKLADLKESPMIRTTLEGNLLVGSKIVLDITLHRVKGGRKEEMKVSGSFLVQSLNTLTHPQGSRVEVGVTSMGEVPVWRAVKGSPHRPLAPAKSPRTPLQD